MTHDTSIDRRAAILSFSGAAALLASHTNAQAPGGVPGSGNWNTPKPSPITPKQLGWDDAKGEYTLPPLPYTADALEPHIDKQTMIVHHSKHHAAYVAGLNGALAQLASIRDGQGDPALIKHWSRELSFHASGHVNHALFWLMMAPPAKGTNAPADELAKAIDRDFGSLDRCLAHFKAAANQVEGGGWAWLALDPWSRRLTIHQVEKQQDLSITGFCPILGIDVWEHAYYLKHQNRRSDYVTAWLNVANWKFAGQLFDYWHK